MVSNEFFACVISCFFCLVFALIFAIKKGKAAMLISGFNTLTKEQRALYDTERMSRDQRNLFLLWALVLGVGAALAYFFSRFFGDAAFLLWAVLFLKELKVDEEKAFGRYRK